MTSSATRTIPTGLDQLLPGKVREARRVRTGIPELDEMLRGGFMEGDAVLLAGSAGTGKTTLGLQYLVNGVSKFNEAGVYVTFEELPDRIYRDAANFGWDLRRMEEENMFKAVCTSPNLLLESVNILDETVREIRPKRIVIDSLSHLSMLLEERAFRREAYRLIMQIKTREISSLLVWESSAAGNSMMLTDVGLSYLVDCVIMLKPVEIESSIRKALAVLKMRGSDHDKHLREFEITPTGVKITSAFANYEGLISGVPRKVASEKFMEMFRKASDSR